MSSSCGATSCAWRSLTQALESAAESWCFPRRQPLVVVTCLMWPILWMGACVDAAGEWERRPFLEIKVGMSEAQVREQLGEPMLVYEKATAPADYYVKGYSFKERDITHKVLIYKKSEPICYVYVDATGTVEDVFVGGS